MMGGSYGLHGDLDEDGDSIGRDPMGVRKLRKKASSKASTAVKEEVSLDEVYNTPPSTRKETDKFEEKRLALNEKMQQYNNFIKCLGTDLSTQISMLDSVLKEMETEGVDEVYGLAKMRKSLQETLDKLKKLKDFDPI